MSDFLGRLVSRSLDGAPDPGAAPVRPLLPSPFEPLAPAAASVWGETVVEAAAPPLPTAHRVQFVQAPLAIPEARGPAAYPPSPPFPSPSFPPGEVGTHSREALVREPSLFPSSGRREGDGREAGGEAPASRNQTAVPTPAPPPSAQAVRRSERPTLPIPPEPSRVAPHDSERPAPPAAPPPPEPRHRVEPVVRRIEAEKVFVPSLRAPTRAPDPPNAPLGRSAPPSVSEPALPVLRPLVPALDREPFPSHREPPSAETVIQVTIGRIEVKATPAPKAPARERPAARTAVDLDEYLKQRARGER